MDARERLRGNPPLHASHLTLGQTESKPAQEISVKKLSRSLMLMITLFLIGGTLAPLVANAQPRHRHHRRPVRRHHYHRYHR